MNTSHLSKVDSTLSADLAEYGLIRAVAAKKAPVRFDKPNFFGFEDRGAEVEMLFTDDDKTLVEATEEGMQLALVAPENESFNMLLTRDFPEAIKQAKPETLREFLRRILDES
jgi:hypothetical protein